MPSVDTHENEYFWIPIKNQVIDYLSDTSKHDKILLINTAQGSGKTITTLKTLCESGKTFIYLGRHHAFVNNTLRLNNVIAPYNIPHIRGRSAWYDETEQEKMCCNPLLKPLSESHVDIHVLLCDKKTGRCKYKSGCDYLQQFKELSDDNKKSLSWGSVYQFLNTDFLKKYRFDVLVLDEQARKGLSTHITFNITHLEKLEEILDVIITKVTMPQIGGYFVILMHTCSVLIDILKDLKSKLTGKEFIDVFIDGISKQMNLEFFATCFHPYDEQSNNAIGNLKNKYKDHLYDMFSNSDPKDYENFKNIFYDVLKIINIVLKYTGQDVNIPVFAIKHPEKKNEFYVYNIIKDIPEVPIIITDATGDKELYEHIFGREIIEFQPVKEIERNIKQITDGFYPKKSLFFKHTRNKLYKITKLLIQHYIDKGICKRVCVVTHKQFGTIENSRHPDNKGKYLGMSLEEYLLDSGLTPDMFFITYPEQMIGSNIKGVEDNKVMVIIGTPEPNIEIFPQDISIWYEGEPPIITDRIIESNGDRYRYKDKRYQTHVNTEREHALEHTIERLRFIKPDKDKEVILISKLPISFETQKMTFKELIDEKDLYRTSIKHQPTYKILTWLKKKKKVTLKEFNNFTRRYVKDTKDCISEYEANNWIYFEKRKTRTKPVKIIHISDAGKKYQKHLEKVVQDRIKKTTSRGGRN